jgi:hypothetical protein
MNVARRSLKMQIEKWFGSVSGEALRITRLRASNGGRARCVIVESRRANESRTIVFFLHGNGSWHVYPPRASFLSIGAQSRAA